MKVSIPVRKDSFAVRFPNKCLFSGKPREAGYLKSVEKKDVVEGKEIKKHIKLMLPATKTYAKEAGRNENIFYITLLIFIVAGFIGGLILSFSDPPFFKTGFLALLMVLMVAGGMAMIVGGTAFLLLKVILNTIAKLLKQSPFEPALGVGVGYLQNEKRVVFNFHNEEIGREFEQLNSIIQDHDPEQSEVGLACPVCEAELHAVSKPILEASRIAGLSEDLQVICSKCGMHLPKYDLMKSYTGEQDPVVFTPKDGSPNDRLFHHIKIVQEGICWYCKSTPARPDLALEIQMYGNVEMKQKGGQLIPTNWGTSTIQVPRCQDCAQNKALKYTHVNHYEPLQVMKAHGWKIGEKPPNVN